MPKNFMRRTYENWFKKNKMRFKYNPWIYKSRKDYFIVRFQHIVKEFSCVVDKSGDAVIWISDQNGQDWDMIQDFDVAIRKTSDEQYYCNLCIEPEMFPDRRALVENHAEDMISYINELHSDLRICLFGEYEKSMWGAELKDKNDPAIKKEFYHTIFPLIVN